MNAMCSGRRTLLVTLLCSLLASAFGADNSTSLDPRRPLVYRNEQGALVPVTTVHEWNLRREDLLRRMQQVMGALTKNEKRCPLDMQTLRESDGGSYVVREITFASEPGSATPALLFIPKNALSATERRTRAALCLHPTNLQLGHKAMTAAGANSSYAIELAQRGFVAIAPAYPLMGDYQPDLQKLGYASGTMKAIRDNMRAIDLLAELPFVKADHVAALGHSLGGHNAIFTAVFDPRIAVIVSSCGFDSFLDYYDGSPAMWAPGKGWTQERYMPRLADYFPALTTIPFDFHELIAALAPRRVWIHAPLHDTNFRWQSVDRVADAARTVYELHGAGQNLTVEHPDCPHEFPIAMRERAYQAIEDALREAH
jgi:dienelactone hydrolase